MQFSVAENVQFPVAIDSSTEALLFQTGYLTIAEEVPVGVRMQYRLRYPNLEVRQALNEHLLRRLAPDTATRIEENQARLYRLLETNDAAGMARLFHAFFAGIPHQRFTKNDIADYEGYYASVFYSYFTGLGVEVTVEDSTNVGRLDMAVRAGGAHLAVRVQGDRASRGEVRR